MGWRSIGWVLLVLSAVCVAGVRPAQATDFSFSGTFTRDDEHQLFRFTIRSPSNVTLRTWSYAGGMNAQGQTIARGGFDPILALFNGAGNLIGANDDGECTHVAQDTLTHQCWDTFLLTPVPLAPGNYFANVAQFDNLNNGSIAGGIRDGEGNFTATFECPTQVSFNDSSCVDPGLQRDGHWAFDILNVDQATLVHEPAFLLLFGAILAALPLFRRGP